LTILLTSFAPWLCHHRSNSSDDLLVSIQDNYAKKLLFLRQLPVNTHMAESRYRLSLESQARSSTKKLLTSIPLPDLIKNLDYSYISDNAGQFVCEELYFQVLKYHPRALFVHVPLLTDKNFTIIQRDFQKIITLSR